MVDIGWRRSICQRYICMESLVCCVSSVSTTWTLTVMYVIGCILLSLAKVWMYNLDKIWLRLTVYVCVCSSLVYCVTCYPCEQEKRLIPWIYPLPTHRWCHCIQYTKCHRISLALTCWRWFQICLLSMFQSSLDPNWIAQISQIRMLVLCYWAQWCNI